jgi:hypothetical protein
MTSEGGARATEAMPWPGRGEHRIADSEAQAVAANSMIVERGSIRAVFDNLGLGWTYDDVWDYLIAAPSFQTLPERHRGIVAGMVMGFATVAVERERERAGCR